MLKGDISNITDDRRTLVNARTFCHTFITIDRGLLGISGYQTDFEINLTNLARIVRASQALPRMILVTTDNNRDYCEQVLSRLNEGYEHPFKGSATYTSDQDLAVMLAWMPNTMVVDVPDKAAVYGSRFLDIPW
mgnify:CR=1 FL=1|jgi:hypothetical protein